MQRYWKRLILSLDASHHDVTLFSRAITQAYLQSHTHLERQVYIRPPSEMSLPPSMVFLVKKPLYGIPESGLHWYLTYLEHNLGELGMTRTRLDPCVFVKRTSGILEGIVALQVDDSLAFGSEAFLLGEEQASKRFRSKQRKTIDDGPITFNGLTIHKKGNTLDMTQEDKIYRLKHPTDQDGFNSVRELSQYVGVCTRPDVCAAVQLIAPGADPTTDAEMKLLGKSVDRLLSTKDKGLQF